MHAIRSLAILAGLLVAACSSDVEANASSDGSSVASAGDVKSATTDEVSAMTRELFSNLSATLAGVEDAASAKAAKPALEKLATRSIALAARRKELAAGGNEAEAKMQLVKDMLSMKTSMDEIGAHFSRIEHVEGVREELEAVMTKISNSFTPR